MTSVLDEIIGGVREDLALRRSATTLRELDARAAAAAPALDPLSILRAASGIAVIAEVKRRSPSKGQLAPIPDPGVLAASYAAGGASAISVLTEERRFGGSLNDLDEVRAAVRIPVLRKDFMVDPYQLSEARAHGADLILLIVAALDDAHLRDLYDQAIALGMTPLVEVHDLAELERALALDPVLVGVNARNLKTLTVDPQTVVDLLPLIPEGTLAVAESGVTGPESVATYVRAGAGAVLVGESLVTGAQPEATVRAFISAAAAIRTETADVAALAEVPGQEGA